MKTPDNPARLVITVLRVNPLGKFEARFASKYAVVVESNQQVVDGKTAPVNWSRDVVHNNPTW